MEKRKLLEIMNSKIKAGWNFEKLYEHLVILDDMDKIYKDGNITDSK